MVEEALHLSPSLRERDEGVKGGMRGDVRRPCVGPQSCCGGAVVCEIGWGVWVCTKMLWESGLGTKLCHQEHG